MPNQDFFSEWHDKWYTHFPRGKATSKKFLLWKSVSIIMNNQIKCVNSSLGNFLTDIMCQCTEGEIAILNSGIMRSKRIHPPGPFTMKDLLSILPFTSTLVIVKCTGNGCIACYALTFTVITINLTFFSRLAKPEYVDHHTLYVNIRSDGSSNINIVLKVTKCSHFNSSTCGFVCRSDQPGHSNLGKIFGSDHTHICIFRKWVTKDMGQVLLI